MVLQLHEGKGSATTQPHEGRQRIVRPTVLGEAEDGRVILDDNADVSQALSGWGYSDRKLRVRMPSVAEILEAPEAVAGKPGIAELTPRFGLRPDGRIRRKIDKNTAFEESSDADKRHDIETGDWTRGRRLRLDLERRAQITEEDYEIEEEDEETETPEQRRSRIRDMFDSWRALRNRVTAFVRSDAPASNVLTRQTKREERKEKRVRYFGQA
ncbi:MAG: hypothetical protein A2186_02730 [Candidatus Levybacteria bacterium RIFOXYA1_FULL_41_10]|nr:MAG: hypothetical protein A2186_02730 [Candidatus Levybacteria bacterium RIFOXYA1_FULL_41_10]